MEEVEWEKWKGERLPDWLKEVKDLEQNSPHIYSSCKNLIDKVYTTERVKAHQLEKCRSFLEPMLASETRVKDAFARKKVGIELARRDCENKVPLLKAHPPRSLEQFNECINEENVSTIKEIWNDRALEFYENFIQITKPKPPAYYKDPKKGPINMERELLNLFKEYGFVLTKKELKDARKDLSHALDRGIRMGLYNYKSMMEKILPSLPEGIEPHVSPPSILFGAKKKRGGGLVGRNHAGHFRSHSR
jgi:hypothetical protein